MRNAAIEQALRAHGTPSTPGIENMAEYLSEQVSDTSHRDVLGPLRAGNGASGVIIQGGDLVGSWGDPCVPEMLFSASKSVISLVAGVAFDDGLLVPETRVKDSIELPAVTGFWDERITWQHLLQQTSMWEGELWGKPSRVDAQSTREGDEATHGDPGTGWAYNDVRVNVLALALTELLGKSLPDVLRDRVMDPLGGSSTWSWHSYGFQIPGRSGEQVEAVSGGAHWGGGVFMSAHDLALVGQLFLEGGGGLISSDWVRRSWTGCEVKPSYGYLWWLNEHGAVWPRAPRTGRCARGNGGRHLLWVDPARELVISSHWTEDIESLIAEISTIIS